MSTLISIDENYSISPAGHTRSVTSLIFTGIYFFCVVSPLLIWFSASLVSDFGVLGGLAIIAFLSSPLFLMGSILFAVLGAIFDKGPNRSKMAIKAGACCLGVFLIHMVMIYLFFQITS